ncbi:hypothetical protein J7382_00960 [Shimia sp. R11_0]|uniref:calcium-binding protein n=1 Tax=Shimia sp. R11_0 TaxID=2821096 RepID=UPI001ADB36A4|nr:calcium-binding protein [Shimia sp. R11_0]MBO9476090.1 hypothetical protein [Shimia sp. R11_0]
MTVYVFAGFTVTENLISTRNPVRSVETTEVTFGLSEGRDYIVYLPTNPSPGELPFISPESVTEFIAFGSQSSDDIRENGASYVQPRLGEITWSGGTSQVLVYEARQGATLTSTYIYLGGAPLPDITSVADWIAFESSITSRDAINSGPFAPLTQILYDDLPYLDRHDTTHITNQPGVTTLEGTGRDDMILADGTHVLGSFGNDVISYVNTEDGTFSWLEYSRLAAGITVNLDQAEQHSTVDLSPTISQNLIDFFRAMDTGHGNRAMVDGTRFDDVFNINLNAASWLSLGGRRGDDVFNLSGSGTITLEYGQALFGITARLNTGVIQDGDGGTDRVNFSAGHSVTLSVLGSRYADNITGSARDEGFVVSGGNDTLRGWGGRDSLLANSADVSDLFVNLTTGIATGQYFGQSFSLTLGGIEDVAGSLTHGSRLAGDANNNRLEGFAGNDTLFGAGGDDTLIGGDGNDLFVGSNGDDSMFGDAGNDTWQMGRGLDMFDGGAGTDLVIVEMDNFGMGATDVVQAVIGLNGGIQMGASSHGAALTSVENIRFHGSNDVFVFGDYTGNIVSTGSGNDSVRGGGGFDRIWANNGNDTVMGDAGNDTIGGMNGNDALWGGAGQDRLFGGAGNDTLAGGQGNDRLYGGIGNDTLNGGSETDSLYGGDGHDVLRGGAEYDILRGGRGNDLIEGEDGDDDLLGENGQDTLNGGDGDDYLNGGGWGDQLNGGTGNDQMNGGLGNDSLFGGTGNDTLYGGRQNDALYGGTGADSLFGESGNDTLFGGIGDDFISGGGGNDRLVMGPGNDAAFGGSGADVFVFGRGGGASNRIQDFTISEGDRLELDDALWRDTYGTLTAEQVITIFGSASSVGWGEFTLDFGSGNVLTLEYYRSFDHFELIDIV